MPIQVAGTQNRVAGRTETRVVIGIELTSATLPAVGPRVLLVDDNYFFRAGLKTLLAAYAIQVVGEAGNGWEAVEQADALRPDIVLMDLRMPQLGGVEAARLIREHQPHTQVIILTAYDEPEFRDGTEDGSVVGYLVKGSRPESIHEALVAAYGAPVPAVTPIDPADPANQDEALQRLTAAQMHLATLRRDAHGPDQQAAFEALEDAVEIDIRGLRDLVFEIQPPTLEPRGLATAIESLLARHAETCGYQWTVHDELPTQPRQTIYSAALGITREAIDNIRQHAEATTVRVALEERRGGGIRIEIVDDGRGLKPSDLSDAAVGLAAMRSRAEEFGGSCRIWSLPGAGTTVKLSLPS